MKKNVIQKLTFGWKPTNQRLMLSLVEMIDPAGDKPYVVEIQAYVMSEDGLTARDTPRSSVVRKFETLTQAQQHLWKRLRKLRGWVPIT